MTTNPPRSPSFRLSRQGFQPLNNTPNSPEEMGSNDIPLQTVVSHTPSHAPTMREDTEKGGFLHRGRRKVQKVDSQGGTYTGPGVQPKEEKTALNHMGRLYTKILNFSIVTRYMIYVAPLALILAIPIILSQTGIIKGPIGGEATKTRKEGADARKFFIWIEIVWLSFWACKIIAHFLPRLFEFLVGVVSPGVRKYSELLRALEKPLSFVFWMIVNQVTFPVLITSEQNWVDKMQSVLLAMLVCTAIILAERVLIQLISISYHRKQFDDKIKESKRNIHLVGVLYDASRALFPAYCEEFAEEDYIIQDSLQLNLGSKKGTFKHGRSGSGAPMRILQDVGRVGDKVTSVFGTIAQEITGKKVFDPNSAHSIVLEALEKNRTAEALARRIWMSFVVEGKNSLYQEDLIDVMGAGRQADAEECFFALDRDGNGDISLDEMILTVTEFGRERKSIASSMHDVDQAINALDALLFTIVSIVCIFVFICFLSPSFVGTLATSATALLSLSFVFAATCQEVLGSCIFLFVKHPYDIGDRVDISTDELTVEHISLLYTVFKRVSNGKMVQTPNIVLNNLWVENITRSKAMREQVSVFVAFDTTFEDINLLKHEMRAFVSDPAHSRDFHSDIEIEVVDIAEMNKMELKIEIRHKGNWSNEPLRAARRSKFMCALVLALRKIPIYGPAGGDVGLGDANNPSWSVAVSPEQAIAARENFLKTQDEGRLVPTKKPDDDNDKGKGYYDEGKSTGVDYLGMSEGTAISNLNSRRPGADPIRDDTWNSRGDDVSTLGRPSMDGRPEIEEVRGLLRKASSSGRRRKQQGLSPHSATFAQAGVPPVPSPQPQVPTFGQQYAPVPGSQPRTPASPSSVSTGRIEEFQFQTMDVQQPQPPQRHPSRPYGGEGNAFAQQQQTPTFNVTQHHTGTAPGSNNPYRAQSPDYEDEERRAYRP